MTALLTPGTMPPAPTLPRDAPPPIIAPPTNQTDPLAEVDDVLGTWSGQRQAFAQRQAEARAAGQQFERNAHDLARTVLRPALDALAARLKADGGGGRVDERILDGSRSYRLTLWMSLEGGITTPRQDRNPYLQIDLDVPNRRFEVWEGDMWEKQGSSRNSTPWQPGDITTEAVTERVIAILRRAASHDVVA